MRWTKNVCTERLFDGPLIVREQKFSGARIWGHYLGPVIRTSSYKAAALTDDQFSALPHTGGKWKIIISFMLIYWKITVCSEARFSTYVLFSDLI